MTELNAHQIRGTLDACRVAAASALPADLPCAIAAIMSLAPQQIESVTQTVRLGDREVTITVKLGPGGRAP